MSTDDKDQPAPPTGIVETDAVRLSREGRAAEVAAAVRDGQPTPPADPPSPEPPDAIAAAAAAARPVNPTDAALAPLAEALADGIDRAVRKIAADRAEGKHKRKTDCNLVAETIMEETTFVQDRVGTMFIYTGTHWEECPDAFLHHLALKVDQADTTQARRSEIASYIKAKTHKRDLQWGRCADHEIAFANGVLDVLTGAMREHRAEDYLENVIPHAWPASPPPAPKWQAALASWFPTPNVPDDAERGEIEPPAEILALQEFYGYVLLPHSKFKKALVALGESDTGKSIHPKLMRAMVGEKFCCTLGVDRMDDPTLCAVLVGKRLNTVTEISEGAMVSDGGFKTLISTEEAILVNEKYKPAYEYTPHAKHVFVTNNLPRVNDRTKAVFNRLLIVIFKVIFAEKDQDPDLFEKLVKDMPGILAWAVDGARRLIEQRGKFTVPADSAIELKQYMEEMNPFIAFAGECMVEGKGIKLGRLVDAFNGWNRGSRKSTMRQVTKMARDAGYTIKSLRLEDANGKSIKGLVGWDLQVEAADTEMAAAATHAPADMGDGEPIYDDPPPPED